VKVGEMGLVEEDETTKAVDDLAKKNGKRNSSSSRNREKHRGFDVGFGW
jgi:hypothetical protein